MVRSNKCDHNGQDAISTPDGPTPSPAPSASLRLRLIVGAIFLLCLALGFNALLTINKLESLYVNAVVSKYAISAKDLQRKLEKSLRFGKSIQKFVGMEEILAETQANLNREIFQDSAGFIEAQKIADALGADHTSVSVADPEGHILYSTDSPLVGTVLPTKAMARIDPEKWRTSRNIASSYKQVGSDYLVLAPVFQRNEKWVATIVVMFSREQIRDLMRDLMETDALVIGAILGTGVLLLILLLNPYTKNVSDARRFPKKKISWIMFSVICLSQIVFSGINLYLFKNYYLKINREKAAVMATILKEDVAFLLGKGLRLDKLFRMDVMLGEILAAAPELDRIAIYDEYPAEMTVNAPLYIAEKEGGGERVSVDAEKTAESGLQLRLRIDGEAGGGDVKGVVIAQLSKETLFYRLREIGLDSLTVLVISILFFVEIQILIFQFLARHSIFRKNRHGLSCRVIRPAAFLFLFGVDLSISFLPLYTETLYEPLWGMNVDVAIGMPISAEFLMVGISILLAGIWIDKRGWREPLIMGIVLALAGTIYSWLSPDMLNFIASRGIVGVGYGCVIMAAQGFTIANTDDRRKAQGLSQLWAGVYAGSICGGAAGAMLAERIGFNPVFLIGAGFLLVSFCYTLAFMIFAEDGLTENVPVQPAAVRVVGRDIFRYVTNRNVLGLLLFASLPASLAFVGFLYYFSPVYLNRIGASQSNIGRVYMIYGICLIYIAPYISRFVDASENKKGFIFFSGFLGGVGFLTFYFFGGVAATAITVLMLGLSGSFDASRAFALKFKVTRELGEGKAMAIFNSGGRIGQVLAPLAFGWLIAGWGVNRGVVWFGVAYLVSALVFFMLTQNDRKIATQRLQ
jgi:predicted MFS family arabinose efflux permease